MVEVLYCPRNNKIYLSTQVYELDIATNTMVLYLITDSGNHKVVPEDLVHIGWL